MTPSFVDEIIKLALSPFYYLLQSVFNVFSKKLIKSILQHTCPICYEPKLAFKKQHKNLPNHPPHLVCTDCDDLMKEIFAQNAQIFCPICRTYSLITPRAIYATK